MTRGLKLYGFGEVSDIPPARQAADGAAAAEFALSPAQRSAIRDALGADIDPRLTRARDTADDVAAPSSWTMRLMTALWHIETFCERCRACWQAATTPDRRVVRLLRSAGAAARRIRGRAAERGWPVARRRVGGGVLPRLFDG